MSYFQDIQTGIRTTIKGLRLTLRHVLRATRRRTPEGIMTDGYFDQPRGLVTLQYPHEQLPIPDNGRYRLRNEIEDCIVCDKCAKVCPVDCITIDAIKATEEVGRASDGSPIRLYAAKFDIDMAKCCYCGLCTVVCPTECLTMDKKFDYSEFELGKLTYHFSELTPEQADEKRALYEQFLREKEEAKRNSATTKQAASSAGSDVPPVAKPAGSPARPVFRPTAKPVDKAPPVEHKPANSEGSSIEHPLTDATPDEMQQIAQGGLETTKKPVFRPTRKPVVHPTDLPTETQSADQSASEEKPATPRPGKPPTGFRPTMKPGAALPPQPPIPETKPDLDSEKPAAKPAGFRPTMKPPVDEPASESGSDIIPAELKPVPTAFRPTMKPAANKPEQEPEPPSTTEPATSKPAGFRPTMKLARSAGTEPDKQPEDIAPDMPKSKPTGFRPTMKPASPPKTAEIHAQPDEKKPATASPDESPEESATEPPRPSVKPAGFRPTMKPKAKPDEDKPE